MMRKRAISRKTLVLALASIAILLVSSVSVTAWSGFHNDKYRAGHIATDTSDITWGGGSESLIEPSGYVASPVADP